MLEAFNQLIFMDGNGHFVWFCLAFLFFIFSLNILYAIIKKRKILRSIKEL
tara:strand:+ start:14 stop:166 length:153 start_codon:yes stop_codon:yes gene_type:complete